MTPDSSSWRDYWEKIDDDQDVFRIEARDYVRRLLRQLPLTRDMRVLDFGCGFGHTSAALAPHVASVAVWDASAAVRERARQRLAGLPNVAFPELAGPSSLADGGRFDAILVHSVLQYMTEDEIRSWLQAWGQALAPRGRLILSDLLQHNGSGLGEILGYLGFAARNGFFLDAFVSGVREFGSYSQARSVRPLTLVRPHEIESWANQCGLTVEWLPANLSHRRSRKTGVLTMIP